ncbi:NrsF family protein [Ancylobacter sp. A5.8]|uniref:NrsF family protein n=1 Tax=Ancylobacter gelatini TaxID=2919920 RepID=UPI001F4E317C|nr:NrsF family protein [Ancylobacter gelatini]
MKTDDLIDLLAKDAAPQWPFRTLYMAALCCGIVLAGVLFFTTVGLRPNIALAAETVRFPLKFALMLPLALGAAGVTLAMAQPAADRGIWGWFLIAASALAIGAVAIELYVLPSELWMTNLVGQNAAFCLRTIPMLALGPLLCLLYVLRRGAPTHPGRTGAWAGLAAGAIGATWYAAHCPDDSPLFVAVWYSLGITVMTLAGYAVGRSRLRW